MNLGKEQLQAVCAELAPALRSGALQEIRQSDPHTFQLTIRKPGRTFWLEASVLPRNCRILAVTRRKTCLSPAPGFLARLRKELEGARILDLEMPWDDRVVVLSMVKQSEGLQLVVELTGQHANLFLTDAHRIILASLLPSSSHQRTLLAGHPYVPPPDAVPRSQPTEPDLSDHWDPELDLPLSLDLEMHYEELLGQAQFELRRKQMADEAKRQLDRVKKRVVNLQTDLLKLGEPAKLMRAGELLKGALGQVKRGMESIRVPDYFQEEAPEVELTLRPEWDARQNLSWYFDRYKRAQRGATTVRQRLADSLREAQNLQERLDSIWRCGETHELDAIEQQRIALGKASKLPKPGAASRSRAALPAQRHKPFKVFQARTGRQILVGKGGKDNHELTFKHSSPHDIWLHVRGFPGSHVIVPLAREQELDPETLVDAAHLALHYSQAPQQGYNEVIWTRRKWVKAVKGGAPGKVQVTQERTIQITLDSPRLKRLLEAQMET